MKNLVFLIIIFGLSLSSCKSDKFSHSDKDYLYYWVFDIRGDSTLERFHKPRTVEYRVCGGRHKTTRRNRRHRIYVYKSDKENSYESIPIYNSNRCEIVDRAKDAEYKGKILIGIFRESFYPHYKLEFIKYKN